MTKIEALEYLVQNETCFDEWSEAGMYVAVRDIIKSEKETFEKDYLDELLEEARNN